MANASKTGQHKFTPLHRILHWLIAFAMPVMFVTGFLRMRWMNKNHIVNIIQSQSGNLLNKEQMTSIAKSIREPMWQWHVYIAHVVILSLLARIIYMIAKGIRFPHPFAKDASLKERFQGFTYLFFYFFVTVNAITGIIIKLSSNEALKHFVEPIHKLAIYWFPLFILLHIAGLIIAEFTNKKGIVSKMIGGED